MGFWSGTSNDRGWGSAGSAAKNTISDESWFSLRRRALKAQEKEKGGMFSKKSVHQRKMQGESLKKAWWN